MTEIVFTTDDLHNALNEYVKKNFGDNLMVKEFDITKQRRANKGHYKARVKIENKKNGGEK